MKTTSIIAAVLALAAAASVSAQEATYELPQPAVSTTTRAAVTGEMLQARADGTLQVTEFDRQAWGPFVATRSRAEVVAEPRAAAASGELQALHGETNSFDGQIMSRANPASAPVVAAAKQRS
jgi:hypothetical protein